MNIADELVVAILYRPRLRVEDAIRKLGSLVSMGKGEYPDLLRGGYMIHMDTNIQGPKHHHNPPPTN